MAYPQFDYQKLPPLPSLPDFSLDRLFSEPVEIRTPRLLIRPMTLDDADGIFDIYGDPEVGRLNLWTPLPHRTAAMDKIRVFQTHFVEGKRVRWGLTLPEEGRVIGDIAIVAHDYRMQQGEIGFNLSLAHQGNGYMSEALRGMWRFLFGEIGFRRIVALVNQYHEQCHRLLEAVGFQREGTLRQAVQWEGRPIDVWQFGLLPGEIRWKKPS